LRTGNLELLEQAMKEELSAEFLLHRPNFGYQGGREGSFLSAEDGLYVGDVEHLVVALMKVGLCRCAILRTRARTQGAHRTRDCMQAGKDGLAEISEARHWHECEALVDDEVWSWSQVASFVSS
jgi:hypothetical protein